MSILSTILGVETSGGNNITQGPIGDINNRTGDLAQGYFQITGGTWAQFGGLATGYNSAINAPASVQEQIAENIPVSRWGPATQQALQAAGYQPQRGETLGQMLARYGENPSDTVAADGSTFGSGGSSGGSIDAYTDASGQGLFGDDGLQGADTTGLFNNLDDSTFDGSDTPGGIGSDAVASNTAYSMPADSIDWSDLPDNTFDGSALNVPSASVVNTGGALQGTPNLGGGVSQMGAGTATPTNAGQNIGGGGGAPINITDLPGADTAITGAGAAVQKGATTAGSDVQTAAGGIAGTLASIVNNVQSYSSSAIVVIGLMVLGLVFVGFGLGMFNSNSLIPKFT